LKHVVLTSKTRPRQPPDLYLLRARLDRHRVCHPSFSDEGSLLTSPRRLIAVLAGAITYIKPNRRPFSLVDPQISFPYVPKEKVSIGTLFGVALAAPAVLIVLIALLVVPSTKLSAQGFRSHRWTRKLWEWNAGWLGLALSFAVTALLTNGLKILLGKPRPDMLAICKPDLANAAAHILGGINDQISEGTLVSSTICRPSDAKALKDAFQSFPSGHASCR